MDLTAIASAGQSLKALHDGIKVLLNLKEDVAIRERTSELLGLVATTQFQLLEAQAQQSAALGRIAELEAEARELKAWAVKREHYELHKLASGTFVYRVKEAHRGTEPVHDLCPRCYQEGIPSILQAAGVKEGCHAVKCPEPKCGAVYLGERYEALCYTAPRHDPYRGF